MCAARPTLLDASEVHILRAAESAAFVQISADFLNLIKSFGESRRASPCSAGLSPAATPLLGAPSSVGRIPRFGKFVVRARSVIIAAITTD